MRKSSFGQFTGRLSSGPLRIKNDSLGPRKSAHTPQALGKVFASSSSRPSAIPRSIGTGSSQRVGSSTAGSVISSTRSSNIGVRSSSIGVRNSGIGARGSGIGVRSRTDVPKDTRPVTEKSYQHRCISILLDFLTEREYPHPLSAKLLQSPSAKDFFRIFEFIYGHLSPSFKVSGRMEEQVPRVLRMLGYPFIISRSSMQAVGTPHTWPYLLVAIVWLVHLVQTTLRLDKSSLLDPVIFPPSDDNDFDNLPDDKILFEYSAQTYAAYLEGVDEYDAFDDDLGKLLDNKYLGQAGGVEAIHNENQRILQEIQLLEQEMGRLDRLQEDQEVMLLDERKFQDYLTELELVIRKHRQMVQDNSEQQSSLEQELKSVQNKNRHMQAIYEQQDLTPADVERLRLARQELQRQEENLEKDVESIDADIWTKEMSISKLLEQVDSNTVEYNKLARALKLTPASGGINFELHSSVHDQENRFESVIKLALEEMKKRKVERVRQVETTLLKEERCQEDLDEQLHEIQGEISSIDKDIQVMDEDCECRKQLYQRDIEGLQTSIDCLQQKVRSRQMSSQMSMQDAEREYREVYSWAERQKTEMSRREEEMASFLMDVVKEVTNRISHNVHLLQGLEREMSTSVVQEEQQLQAITEKSRQLRMQFDS